MGCVVGAPGEALMGLSQPQAPKPLSLTASLDIKKTDAGNNRPQKTHKKEGARGIPSPAFLTHAE